MINPLGGKLVIVRPPPVTLADVILQVLRAETHAHPNTPCLRCAALAHAIVEKLSERYRIIEV